jgi:hypothetical protein
MAELSATTLRRRPSSVDTGKTVIPGTDLPQFVSGKTKTPSPQYFQRWGVILIDYHESDRARFTCLVDLLDPAVHIQSQSIQLKPAQGSNRFGCLDSFASDSARASRWHVCG